MGYAIVTLIGHNLAYDAKYGSDIFTGIEVPEGANRDIMVEEIFHRCGEFSVGHTDFEFMHEEILHFFKVHKRTFERMFYALSLEYNPLENYDRQETWRDDGQFQNNNSSTENGSTTSDNTQETKNMRTDYNSNTTTERAAFNSNGYEDYEKNSHGGNDTINGKVIDDGETTHNNTITGNNNGTDASVHTGRIHGNIGVTTSQQMLKSEYEDAAPLNAYKTIADYFADEYCIQVY